MNSFKVIEINGIEVQLQRKRIKSMHLYVKPPDGRVVVTAPVLMPESVIRSFVASKENWITEHRNIAVSRFSAPKAGDREKLNERIKTFLPKWENITELHCSSWHIRNMTSRWGSCNTETGRLCFNLQLAGKSDRCLEYVILHELAHLRERGHGAAFKAILDEYMPEWRSIRKELNN